MCSTHSEPIWQQDTVGWIAALVRLHLNQPRISRVNYANRAIRSLVYAPRRRLNAILLRRAILSAQDNVRDKVRACQCPTKRAGRASPERLPFAGCVKICYLIPRRSQPSNMRQVQARFEIIWQRYTSTIRHKETYVECGHAWLGTRGYRFLVSGIAMHRDRTSGSIHKGRMLY